MVSELYISDFDSNEWKEIILPFSNKNCEKCLTPLSNAIKSHEDNPSIVRAFSTLMQISSFHLRAENTYEPYGAMMIMDGSRTAIPDDLSDEQLNVLKEKIDCFNIDLKARIADVLWIRNKEHAMAKKAIHWLFESAKIQLSPDDWVYGYERLERAFRLAKSLGKSAYDELKMIYQYMDELLISEEYQQRQYLSIRVLELLQIIRVDFPEKYAEVAKKMAILIQETCEYIGANDYWECSAKWYEIAKLEEQAKEAKILAAECYVLMANATDSAMVKANFLQRGIEAFRRIGGSQSRTKELHTLMLEVQTKISDEMGRISTDIELTPLIEYSINRVKGKTLHEALQQFCLLSAPQSVEELKNKVEDLVKTAPFQFIVSKHIVDYEGKVVAVFPSMLTASEKERNDALHANMVDQSQFERVIAVNGEIEPARSQILLEHNITLHFLSSIVQNNLLVPAGREHIVAKGLLAGFYGEWIEATNILVPQFEEAIRYVLKQNGEIVSGLENNLQDNRSLNTTLDNPLIDEIFGDDLAFELRALLINRFGPNLRNKVAHGLMHTNEFFSHDVIYFWWLYLRLVCWPMIMHNANQDN